MPPLPKISGFIPTEPFDSADSSPLFAGMKTGLIMGSGFACSAAGELFGKTTTGKLVLGILGGSVPTFFTNFTELKNIFDDSVEGSKARGELALNALDMGLSIATGIAFTGFLSGLVASVFASAFIEGARSHYAYEKSWKNSFDAAFSAGGWNLVTSAILHGVTHGAGKYLSKEAHERTSILHEPDCDFDLFADPVIPEQTTPTFHKPEVYASVDVNGGISYDERPKNSPVIECAKRVTTATSASSPIQYDTNTRLPDGRIVPWLAAKGPLSFTPENPPTDLSLHDYGRIMPGLFTKEAKYLWGISEHDGGVETLKYFWQCAADNNLERVHVLYGEKENPFFKAPMAVYKNKTSDMYMLMQNGVYQFVRGGDHPRIAEGFVRIHCGIGTNSTYVHKMLWSRDQSLSQLSDQDRQIIRAFFKIHEVNSSDSILNFIAGHQAIVRPNTAHIQVTGGKQQKVRANQSVQRKAEELYRRISTENCFSLNPRISQQKFGPNYGVLDTPLSNIRLTSWFAGESEVRLINPIFARVVSTQGCDVRYWSGLEGL